MYIYIYIYYVMYIYIYMYVYMFCTHEHIHVTYIDINQCDEAVTKLDSLFLSLRLPDKTGTQTWRGRPV